jgi:hypothetical protein
MSDAHVRVYQVIGELVGEGRHYTPKLDLKVRELKAGVPAVVVNRAVVEVELTPMSTMVVEDGTYELKYEFDGRKYEQTLRITNGLFTAATPT